MPLLISRTHLSGAAKAWVARMAAWTGSGASQTGWRILLYHAITAHPTPDRWGRAVPLNAFAQQLDYLGREGYVVRPVHEVATQLQRGEAPAPRTVSMTFDDGYAGTWTFAAPAMARYGWVGTVFVTADWVQSDGAQGNGSPLEEFVSWSQLVTLADAGWEIGSHGCSHRRLTQLSDEEIRQEVGTSKAWIEQHTSCRIRSFSFPHGLRRRGFGTGLAQAGYDSACTSRPGLNTARTDRYALRRLEMTGWDTLETFALKLQGGYDWLGVLRRC